MALPPLVLALVSALLFAAATPASKWLLAALTPFQLAGLLYLGAALGMLPAAPRSGGIRLPARSDRANWTRLLGAVVSGGIAGPVLLLLALRSASATSVSLWLGSEVAATALLGALLFREQLGAAGWAGVGAALGGGALLSWFSGAAGVQVGLLVLLACCCWGLDNQWTALIDGIPPSHVTLWKGLVAGSANLAIGAALDPLAAGPLWIGAALLVGSLAYGASIALYIASAQALGATRAQVAFASAPFFGALLSALALREPLTAAHLASGALFAIAVALFAVERHAHVHAHESLEHEHAHRHDDGHHLHEHPGLARGAWHTHRHRHEPLTHAHGHWPDLHHRHRHDPAARG